MSLLWPSYDDRLGELLARSQRGDRDAFRSLYLELYGPVSRFIGRRIGRREDAEDLVARVFQKLLERLDDFDASRGTVPMFVLAMARSMVIDHLRATRGSVPVEDLAGVLADETGTPLDALVREEELREVRALLGELPPDVREMFALRFGDGLRHAQIAEILGIQVAAVKQRFSRALRDLKAKLRAGALRDRAKERPLDALLAGERADRAEGPQEQSERSEGAVVDVRV